MCHFAKQTVHAFVCMCLRPQTLCRKPNSLLNHYDKIVFFVQMLIHEDCVFPILSWDTLILPFWLFPSHNDLSQFLLCLFFLKIYIYPVLFCSNIRAIEEFCSIHGKWRFSHILTREKTITFRKDEWTAITCGKFMVIFCSSSTSLPQIRLVFAHILYVTDDAEAIHGSLWMLHVAAGCHQDHRQSHIIIRSLCCRLWGFWALFSISLLLSAHCFCIALLRAAVNQALDWILKFKFYFT